MGPPKSAAIRAALANAAMAGLCAMKRAPPTTPAMRSHDRTLTASEIHTFWVEVGINAPGSGARNTPNVDATSCNEIDETTNCLLTRRLLGLTVSVTRCRIVHAAAIAPEVMTNIPTALIRPSDSTPTEGRVACRTA